MGWGPRAILGLVVLSSLGSHPAQAQEPKKHPKYLAVVTREGDQHGHSKLRLHDFSTGRLLWTHDFVNYAGGVTWLPHIKGGRITLTGRTLGVLCLDLASGRVRWMHEGKGILNWHPGKEIHVASTLEKTFGIDADTGEVVWTSDTGAKHGAQVRGSGRIFTATSHGSLAALDAKTGEQLWINGSAALEGTIALFDGLVIPPVPSDGEVVAYEARTGEARWSVPAFGEQSIRAWVSEGRLYLSSVRSELRAIDARTGRVSWSFEEGGWIDKSTPDALIVSDLRGRLSCLEAETGKVLWRKPRTVEFMSSRVEDPSFMLIGRRLTVKEPLLVGVDPNTWKELWSIRRPNYRNHPQLRGRELYLATQNHRGGGTHLRRFDTRSGVRSWSVEIDDEFHRLEVVEKWLILTLRSGMVCVRRDTGKVVWHVPCDTVPDSRIYAVHYLREY